MAGTSWKPAEGITDPEFNILAIDERYEAVLRTPRSKLVGANVIDLGHPDDRGANAALLERLRTGGPPFHLTKRYLLPEGGFVWTSIQVSRLSGGGPMRFLSRCRRTLGPPAAPGDEADRQRIARIILDTPGTSCRIDDALAHGPGLSILLALYLAEVENRTTTADEISELLSLFPNEVLRWVDVLAGKELVEDQGTGFDQSASVALTAEGLRRVDAFLTERALAT